MEGKEAIIMSEKATCPKCRSGYLFPEEQNHIVKCMICGYSEPMGSSGKKGAAKLGSLGQYMANYPLVTEVKVVQAPAPVKSQKHERTCIHNQDIVTMGKYKVWLSEAPAKGWLREKPTLGVYMAEPWLNYAGDVMTNGIALGTHVKYDIIYINWVDRGVVSCDCLVPVVRKIIEYLDAGANVEMGCWGGHGRTGTVASCVLGAVENLDGATAIKELRKRYCSHAVEGVLQEKLVKEFCEAYPKLGV